MFQAATAAASLAARMAPARRRTASENIQRRRMAMAATENTNKRKNTAAWHRQSGEK